MALHRTHSPLGREITRLAMRAQLLRRAGRDKNACKALAQAEAARQAVPKELSLDLNWLRVHWRNALLLGAPAVRKRADKFERLCKKRGIAFGPEKHVWRAVVHQRPLLPGPRGV